MTVRVELFLALVLLGASPTVASATNSAAPSGGVSASVGASSHSVTVVDPSGRPVVAWQDGTAAGRQIYVRRLEAGRWVELGAGSASGGGISHSRGQASGPAMVLDELGNPVVAWHDNASGIDQIRVRRFDGTRWVGLNAQSEHAMGISRSPVASRHPVVTLDGQGRPIVAWQEFLYAGRFGIYVKHFDGTRWVELGPGAASGVGISDGWDSSRPSLATDGQGRPVIAWQEYSTTKLRYEIYLRRFDGQRWQEVGRGSATGGGISDSPGESAQPRLVADASGNLVVAWHDDSDVTARPQIFVKRFDGTAWHPLGQNAASGRGISAADGPSRSPSLAVDGRGRAVVAWYARQRLSKSEEIHVKRFDGTRWVQLDMESAGGTGHDAPASSASFPSVSIDRLGRPMVAWHQSRAGSGQIYLRRFDGTHWRALGHVQQPRPTRDPADTPRAVGQPAAPSLQRARLALLIPVDHTVARSPATALPTPADLLLTAPLGR